MISGDEPARLLDLRFHLRLQDRAVRARDWNCVLPQGCRGQSENKRNCTSAAQLDFSSDANHAVSNYQTVSAAVPGVQENQPPRRHRCLPQFLFSLSAQLAAMRCEKFWRDALRRVRL